MKISKLITTTICLAITLALGAGACDRDTTAGATKEDGGAPRKYPYTAATTVGMVRDIVQKVAGDTAKVGGIIGSGVDPHLY
jgi:manganese/zinc/iron transport system substrate-binding protein